MFSLQNQNQAFAATLTQFTLKLTHRPRLSFVKHRSKHETEPLCPESFIETLKNCDFTFAHHLNPRSLLTPNFLNTSYISNDSFFENKHGFSEKDLMVPVPALVVKGCTGRTTVRVPDGLYRRLVTGLIEQNHFRTGRTVLLVPDGFNRTGLLDQNHFSFDVQFRGFKTERTIKAELNRNPTITNRLRDALNMSTEPNEPKPTGLNNEDKLKRLLTSTGENGLNDSEKERIKVAFAEGYLLGNNSGGKGGKTGRYFRAFTQVVTVVIFLTVIFSLMASASGSVFRISRIQLGNQIEVDPEEINVTFEDVKGVDEAKQELKDVVEFLKNPDKFSNLGGKLPKGVLLVGPPGTGKTLLARAVAGEAGVPFFHAAGPEFDEVLVGQGARRVRDLFKAAKKRAPCVIFIDEIDSVGSKRTNSVLHPYANQTINQLLSEMDGFHQNEGVIVLGATNRREDLDQALLRPGRFDVEVTVPTPDYTGRKEILGLYLSKILARDVDLELLARGTTGFTGADLENMVNQAALRAAIDGADSVSMKYLESARDKVLMGPERKSRIPDEEANLITAYHEGGHAIVAFYTKDSHPLHKVTIIPRGPSLGHTAYIPEKERYHVTKSQLLAMMDTMMGGRAAEELIFGPEKITSGASSDLKQATSIATHMVKDWGMSEKVGLRTMVENSKSFQGETLGPTTNEMVDSEIKRILTESYERARHILKSHAKEHKALAEALMKYETLDAEDIKAIMSDKTTEKKKL